MWINKKTFRKLFVTSVYDSYINIPILTKSSNWNYDILTFISGLKEVNTLYYDNSFYKTQEKISKYEYKISYRPIGIKKGISITPNNDLFKNSYIINNSYYTRCQIKVQYSGTGGKATFDLYEDNIFKETVKLDVAIVGSGHYESWVSMIFRIRINHPDLNSHTYTFKNLKISGTVSSNMVMLVLDNYSPEYYDDSRMMGTNILFGEDVKLIKNK